jgi:prepilin-type processing-associated H-X9-DG protein
MQFCEKRPFPARAFTLVELLVVIATVALLAAMLLPALAANTQNSPRAYCSNNLRQIGAATLMYAQDDNDVFPSVKWRSANPTYPYEMFRGTSASFTSGPYNLGLLWSTKIVTEGKSYYCPSWKPVGDYANWVDPTGAGVDIYLDLTYERYVGNNVAKSAWPFGFKPGVLDKDTVRSGYCYFPQLTEKENVATAIGTKTVPKMSGVYTDSAPPERNWICVPPIKVSVVDATKSMAVDPMFLWPSYPSPGTLHHRNRNGAVAGLNAVFADGHVAWQDVSRVPDAFDPSIWNGIASNQGDNLRYVMSLFEP